MNGKALKTGSKSEDLQGVYIFDGFEERPEENSKAAGFCLSLFPFPVAYLFVFNYFAIIIRKRGMNLFAG